MSLLSFIPRVTYKGVAFQRNELAALIAAAVALVAAGFFAHTKKAALAQQMAQHQQKVQTADVEIDDIRRVQGVTEAKVKAIQTRQQTVESRLLTAQQWNDFVNQLNRDEWRFTANSYTDAKDGRYTALRGELTFLTPSVAEAQKILDTLKRVEALSQMLGVEKLTITTDGDATSRHFANVRIAVAVPLRPSK